MTGELIIFPVRVSARVARFALRSYVEATTRVLSAAAYVIRSVTPDASAEAAERTVPRDVAADAAERAVPPDVASPAPADGPTFAPPPAVEGTSQRDEPVHVSEEPTVVAELAEPGAEEGAGAEVHVSEPWPGYARLTASDVIARIAAATPEELAAVQLYESAHQDRTTVVAAVERELRAKSGRGAAVANQTRKEHSDGQDVE
jgi:hypothetical protein